MVIVVSGCVQRPSPNLKQQLLLIFCKPLALLMHLSAASAWAVAWLDKGDPGLHSSALLPESLTSCSRAGLRVSSLQWQESKRGRGEGMQAFKLQLTLVVLLPHWPKRVTWPNPASAPEGTSKERDPGRQMWLMLQSICHHCTTVLTFQ